MKVGATSGRPYFEICTAIGVLTADRRLLLSALCRIYLLCHKKALFVKAFSVKFAKLMKVLKIEVFADVKTHRAGLRKSARHAASVADRVNAVADFEVFADKFRAHGIIFGFHAVEKRIVIGSTGRDIVDSVHGFDDIVKLTFWNTKRQIARHGLQGRTNGGLTDTVVVGTLALKQVAEALDEHTAAADHVA